MVLVAPKAEPGDSANNSKTTSRAMQPDAGTTDHSRGLRTLGARFWARVFSRLFAELSPQELSWLLLPAKHTPMLSGRRAAMIGSRILFIASLFAILTPLWIVVDIITLPQPLWISLAVGRMIATLGFVVLAVAYARPATIAEVHRSLAILVGVPLAFYLYSDFSLHHHPLTGLSMTVMSGYGFLPLVLVSGLAIFPLTLAESTAVVSAVLIAQILAMLARWHNLDPAAFAVALWLFAIIAAAGILAGLSQLAFMMALVRDAIRDPLTGTFSRHSGEELLELQFINSTRAETPLSVAFIDLDHFKRVNDDHGHDAGDRVLIHAADQLRNCLRTGDVLARWGGEEFVLIMPNTEAGQAVAALDRVCSAGLGKRPDGQAVTASIGVAERLFDRATHWCELVDAADRRMYAAKRAGRNQIVALRP
jgi:diguanylate cyclase (GGDEF)-like protein